MKINSGLVTVRRAMVRRAMATSHECQPAQKDTYVLELGLAARPFETRRETRPRYLGLVSQAWSREKFETYL